MDSKAHSSKDNTHIRKEDPDDIIKSVNLRINNSLCSFNLPFHIDLKRLAYSLINVDFNKARGVLLMQIRNPNCLARIYSSGKITVHYCKSESDCKKASRRIGRKIQKAMDKASERICLRNFQINNISASCHMPFGIRIEELAIKHHNAYYEPEISPGVEWRFANIKATLTIHTTGAITIMGATSEANLETCIREIYPLIEEFKSMDRYKATIAIQQLKLKKRNHNEFDDLPDFEPRRKRTAQYQRDDRIVFSDEEELELQESLDLPESP